MAIKRARSASAGVAASPMRGRPAKAAKVTPEINKVVTSIKGHPSMPAQTKSMLCGALGSALASYADERHEFQRNIVGMAATAMGEIDTDKKSTVARAQADLREMNRDRLVQLIPQSAQERAKAKGNAADREAAVCAATLQVRIAGESEKAVKKEVRAADSEYDLRAAKSTNFAGIVERVAAAKTTVLHRLVAGKLGNALKGLGMDASLVSTYVGVVTKAVEERGEFDTLTTSNLDAELDSIGQRLQAELAQLEPAKAERTARVANAEAQLAAANDQLVAEKGGFKDAQGNVSATDAKLSQAQKNFNHFSKHLKKKEVALKKAESDYRTFQTGPMTSFQTLSTRSRPVAAEPEPAISQSPAPAAARQSQPSPAPAATRSPAPAARQSQSPAMGHSPAV